MLVRLLIFIARAIFFTTFSCLNYGRHISISFTMMESLSLFTLCRVPQLQGTSKWNHQNSLLPTTFSPYIDFLGTIYKCISEEERNCCSDSNPIGCNLFRQL
jgi:hypothetical protein